MEDKERIEKLEKKVKRMETVEIIRFVFIILAFAGVTNYLMKDFKKQINKLK
jgi:hypothetical protein